MDYHLLKFLAGKGDANIHPKGILATELLIKQLDVQSGQHLLEIGCGTGESLVRIRSRYQVSLTDMDMLDEMIKQSVKRIKFVGFKDIQIKKVSAESIFPFNSDTFDAVYCESVLGIQNSKGLLFLLPEINRVLKPGGKFIANEAIWNTTTTQEMAHTINGNCIRDFGLRLAAEEALHLEAV